MNDVFKFLDDRYALVHFLMDIAICSSPIPRRQGDRREP